MNRVGVLLLLGILVGTAAPAKASHPAEGFVWSETTGWIDVAPEGGGVVVYPDHLAGFAWSESIGWIKFGADGAFPYANDSAADWGVNRAFDGTLSGYAWSETAGWIRFDSGQATAAVNRRMGAFEGFAWSEAVGWIHLQNLEIPYGPRIELSPLEVPSLGTWGMVALALCCALAGLRALRRPVRAH